MNESVKKYFLVAGNVCNLSARIGERITARISARFRMKSWLPKIVVITVALSTGMSFFAGESFSSLQDMQANLQKQKAKNSELKNTIGMLRAEVTGLKGDLRALERAARNELAMIGPNEEIVIFERGPDEG